MSNSILDGKRILAVDDEPDVLEVLKGEIMEVCPDCTFDKAETFEQAATLMETTSYDIVILDIMGVRGFDLLDISVKKNLKAVMLTARALNPGALKRSYEKGARAYLPKDKLGEIVPFLEDVLQSNYETGWKKLFKKLHVFFTARFGSDWEKETGIPWQEWK